MAVHYLSRANEKMVMNPKKSGPSGEARRLFPGMRLPTLALGAIVLVGWQLVLANDPPGLEGLDKLYPSLDALYIDLHKNPELSFHEEKTASEAGVPVTKPRLRSDGAYRR